MIEYLPWSKEVLSTCLNNYRNGKFSVLDIELGGTCNFNCIYCDSPEREVKCTISLDAIESWLQVGQIQWIHICGIGEPTFSVNYHFLLRILSLCETYNIKCSMFSNAYNLTDELTRYVEKEILYILFKIDSLNHMQTADIYGIDSNKALKQVENINKLSKLVRIRNNTTNLAASIVPTSINKNIVEDLIKHMLSLGIFPMIGDLENSGRGRENFTTLNLSNKELKVMKVNISSMMDEVYTVPHCPAVISSIHINADNQIVVDELSGLSCNWFWMEEPNLKVLLSLEQDISLEVVSKAVIDYRTSKIDFLKEWLKKNNNLGVFGGCGGNVVNMLQKYVPIQEEVEKGECVF